MGLETRKVPFWNYSRSLYCVGTRDSLPNVEEEGDKTTKDEKWTYIDWALQIGEGNQVWSCRWCGVMDGEAQVRSMMGTESK